MGCAGVAEQDIRHEIKKSHKKTPAEKTSRGKNNC
jgi:hypothetical protein